MPKKFWNIAKSAKDSNVGELYLDGPISSTSWWGDEITPKQFKKDLDDMGDVGVINVYINSGGGDVFAGQAIHNMLKRHKAHVNVHVDGVAASIASVIAMAGDTVYIPRNAMMMVHNPWTWGVGDSADFRKIADDLDKIRESIVAAYEEKTSLNRDDIIALLDAETWLTADEAVEYGFADEITAAKEIAASIQDGQLVFNGQSIALEKMKNAGQLFTKLPKAVALATPGIKNTPKKEEKPVMDFAQLLASLPQEHQVLVNAELAKVIQDATTPLDAELQQTKDTLQKAQDELAELKKPDVDDFEAMLATLPESARAMVLENKKIADEARAEAQRLQDEAEVKTYVDKAKALDKIPVKAEEFGPALRAVAKATPEAYALIESTLGAINAALEDSTLFESMGSAHNNTTGTALEQLNAKATEVMARDGVTKEQAFFTACKEDAALYAQYQKELRGEE